VEVPLTENGGIAKGTKRFEGQEPILEKVTLRAVNPTRSYSFSNYPMSL